MEKNSSNGNLPEVKGLVEKYKYDVIAILLLAMLFYGISSIAFGDGLLPNSTYEKLSWLRTATSGGGQSQAGLGGGAVGLEGIGSYHSAKTLEFAGMLAGADVQSAAGLEQAYRLSYLISVVLICAGAYVYSRALGLERQWAFAASCIITSTPYVLLSFATQAGLAPVLAFALCIVGLAAFSLMKKSPLFAIPGFVFSAAGLLSDPHLGLAGALIGFAGACTVILHAMNKNTENTEGRGTGAKLDFARLAPLAAFLLLGAVSALVGSQSFSWYEFQAQKFLFNNIFLAAAASPLLAIAIGKSKQGRELEGLTMFVFALIAGSAFPLAGLFLLAAALPHGIRALLEAGESRIVAAAFAIGFFIAVSLSTHSELVQTLGLGLLFGGFLAGVAYVYKEQPRKAAIIGIMVIAFVAISASAQFAYNKQGAQKAYPQADFEAPSQYFKQALESVAGKEGKIALIENNGFAKFYAGGRIAEDTQPLASFLSGNLSAQELENNGIKYVIVSGRLFASPEKISASGGQAVRARAYRYIGNTTDAQGQALAYFAGFDGTVLVRPIEQEGKFLVQDSVLVGPNGQAAAQIPYSELLVLNSKMAYQDGSNLIVWPVTSHNTNLFKLFFGKIQGARLVGEFGDVRVFEIG